MFNKSTDNSFPYPNNKFGDRRRVLRFSIKRGFYMQEQELMGDCEEGDWVNI